MSKSPDAESWIVVVSYFVNAQEYRAIEYVVNRKGIARQAAAPQGSCTLPGPVFDVEAWAIPRQER